MATLNVTLYVVARNSDAEEGRGVNVARGLYADEAEAVKKAGWSGEVYRVELVDGKFEGDLLNYGNRVYGYRKTPDNKWGYGYIDLRDFNPDPEFAEYQRLQKKFG